MSTIVTSQMDIALHNLQSYGFPVSSIAKCTAENG